MKYINIQQCIHNEIYHIEYTGHHYIGKYSKDMTAFKIIKLLSGHNCPVCKIEQYDYTLSDAIRPLTNLEKLKYL